MRCFCALTLIVCVTAGGCRRSSQQEGPPTGRDSQKKQASASAVAKQAEVGEFIVGQPICYANLTIFPVSSKVPKNEDRYITLDEGLKAGTVEIFEVGAEAVEATAAPDAPAAREGQASTPQQEDQESDQEVEVEGDVNRLMVLNRSGRPLYLMPGEVIYGGKQDRTIGEEAIILAGDKPVPIDVYCVEHGRWSGRAGAETVQALCAFSADPDLFDQETAEKLAADANRGKFVASAGNLSKETRLIVQGNKGQVELWNGVAEANAAADLDVQTGAFTANYAAPEVLDRLKPYIEKLQQPVAKRTQVVGAIVAVNGKVEAVDVFGSTPLFRKLWPKLLKSHALDAANAAEGEDAKRGCGLKDAKEFLHGAMAAEVEETTEAQGGLVVTQRKSGGVVSFSASPEDAAAGGMGMGGFGNGVHSSAFAH